MALGKTIFLIVQIDMHAFRLCCAVCEILCVNFCKTSVSFELLYSDSFFNVQVAGMIISKDIS